MMCHIKSQITRGVFVSAQLSSIFIEILFPYLISQNINSRNFITEKGINSNQLLTHSFITLRSIFAVILKLLCSERHFFEGLKYLLVATLMSIFIITRAALLTERLN